MSGVLSSLFDLSGFFFMFTLNLLVICLVCYYFKRRIETLEHAQMEQSKILRTYIQQANNINIKQDVREETVQEAKQFKNNNIDETNQNNQFSDQPFKKIEINQFTLSRDEDSQSEDTSDDDDDDDDDDDGYGENIQITEDNNIKVLRLGPEDSDDDDDDDDEVESDDEDSTDNNNDIYENDNKNNDKDTNDIVTKNITLEIDYNKLTAKELKSICKERNLTGFNNLKKTDLVELLKNSQTIKQEVVEEITSPPEVKLDNVNTLEESSDTIETSNIEKEVSLDVIEP